jgi:hypothetical protein
MKAAALLLTLTTAVLTSTAASAQDVAMPRFEFGAVASGLVLAAVGDGGGLVLLGGGPTVTVGLTRRIRLDVRAEVLGPYEESGLFGLYQAQFRFPLRQSPDGTPSLSVSAGVGGLFSYHRFREYRTTRRDGSIVVFPGYRDMRATVPRMVTIGVTNQRIVSRRASAIFGADMIVGEGAIVARASVGDERATGTAVSHARRQRRL